MGKPNIILINCDDLGYGDLGCYGSNINKTPAIDKLASNGTIFTDFYMASSVCSPSRAAMLTGCYPKRIGFDRFETDVEVVLFPGDPVGLNPGEITLAQILKDQGYSTKIVGKWHCGDQPEFFPTRFGFDSYYGLPYSNDMGRSFTEDKDSIEYKVRLSMPPLPLMKDEEVIQEQPDQSSLTERYVEQSISFIRENKNDPFFLYFAHMHVHLPHYPPQRFLDQADNGPYGAAVECIDWATDALVSEVKRLDIADNTIIIFTSDNGSLTRFGGSNAPLRGKKFTCWEGGFRVPCIMSWPGKIPEGKVCNDIVTSMDFFPTIAKLTDAEVPKDRIIDGIDISDLLVGKYHPKPDRTFFYYQLGDLCAVRSGKWKYFTETPYYPERLFDLEKDISEDTDLLDKYPEVKDKMIKLLNTCRTDLGDDLYNIKGVNCRPVGRVDNPRILTAYDPAHPYMIAMYDLSNESWG